ncbi:crotonobetainyl-CoA:carnitine CoA-transferase CaiB-like acyl-CoA transferase [Nitrobacteraceae bacterium AZCC 2146]
MKFARIGCLPSSGNDPNSTSEMVRPSDVGEQTKELLAGFGFSDHEITALR